jgi:hypothetical protein
MINAKSAELLKEQSVSQSPKKRTHPSQTKTIFHVTRHSLYSNAGKALLFKIIQKTMPHVKLALFILPATKPKTKQARCV